MVRQWMLESINPEHWFGLRLQCLLLRDKNIYAVRLINIRSVPLVSLKVSVSATIFDDDGRMDFFVVKEIEIPRIDAFTSIDEAKPSHLGGASYSVDCEYSDIGGNAFHERFVFDVYDGTFQEEVSFLPWEYIHIFTQFGHPIGHSVWNPVKIACDNDTNTSDTAIIDMSCILVLGPDSSPYIARLKEIQKAISLLGYNSILVREQKELGHEALEQKLLRLALSTRFAIVEDSTPAGHIDELSLISRSRTIVAVLREHGKAGTWMQSDYDLDFPVQYFSYSGIVHDDLCRAVTRAVDWADQKLRNRSELLGERYPWR